jgi:pimeloyl-ACP methyl ester carboxylesterase
LNGELFTRFGLHPRTLALRLSDPELGIRVLDTGWGEPVVLMHGITLCAAAWVPLLPRLASLRAIAVDMPGHGASTPVDFAGVDLRAWHTRVLHGVLDALGLESAHLVGHSYGGMAALWMALDAPERVRSVVTLGSPAVAFGGGLGSTLRLLARRGIGPLALSLPSPLFAYRALLAASLGHHAIDDAPPELIRALYAATRHRGFARTVSSFLREELRGLDAHPPRYRLGGPELASVRQPTLVLWGDEDPYQPVAEARRAAAHIPDARFTVTRGGHAAWLDDAGAVAELIRDFVARTSSTS